MDFAVTLSVNFLDDVLGVSFGISQRTKIFGATFAIHSVDDSVKCLAAALHRVDFPRVSVEADLDCFFLRYGRLHDVYKQTCTVPVLQALF